MWQAEADTELTMSASPATPIDVNHGKLALLYGNRYGEHGQNDENEIQLQREYTYKLYSVQSV